VLAGILIAILTGLLLGGLLPVAIDVETNSQVASRISPTLLDLAMVAAAGIAGAHATSRSDVADALPPDRDRRPARARRAGPPGGPRRTSDPIVAKGPP